MSLKALDTIAQYKMLDGFSRVLAGVSGGADSMAMLHLLCSLRGKTGLIIFAAHVNHGLRGEEALRDERYVTEICKKWGVPLFVLHADVRGEAKRSGESVEEAGRRVRYEFFARVAGENDAVIATAHTLSDCTETILINFTRGTGLRGLCGIPPVRDGIIRPLIRDTRKETEEYCAQNGIQYVNDSTNFERAFARNKIRLDVLPVLREINPSLEQSVCRLMDNLSVDNAFLSEEAENALLRATTTKGFAVEVLRKLPLPLLSRAVQSAAYRATGMDADTVHIRNMVRLIKEGNARVQLPGGFFAEISHKNFYFYKAIGDSFTFPLKDGVYKNQIYDIIIKTIEINNSKKINYLCFKNGVDCDKIKGTSVIRGRLPGDAYRPAGRGLAKTLKKLFNEAGVPAGERSSIPCVADEKGLLWVAGFGPDERCKIDEGTKRAFVIEIKRMEGNCFDRRY